VADYLELKASMGVVTLGEATTSERVGNLVKLVGLSEGLAANGAFAPQARRKYV
jgi:hypothetical protein